MAIGTYTWFIVIILPSISLRWKEDGSLLTIAHCILLCISVIHGEKITHGDHQIHSHPKVSFPIFTPYFDFDFKCQ